MQKPDIIKLAPTLTAKERMKFILSNWHKTVTEKPFLNESEVKALFGMTEIGDFDECQYFFALYQWSNMLLRDDIEKAWLRFIAGYNYLVHLRGLLIIDLIIKVEKEDGSLLERFEITNRSLDPESGLETMAIKEKVSFFPNPKEVVSTLNIHIQTLFGYRDITQKIESELDIPIFDEKTYARIRGYWTQTEKFISDHNRFIESLEKRGEQKVILTDKEQYILQITPPDPEFVEQCIQDIKKLVESDISKFT